MAETFKQNLTSKQLEEGKILNNYVLLEMMHSSEGIKSKGGIVVGFDTDIEFDDETTSHTADLAEIYGRVGKLPDKLHYAEDGSGMPWDCDMELEIDDTVWFNTIESKNAVEIICEDKIYKLIPYQDIYCAKRKRWLNKMDGKWVTDVIMLNGYVLCEPIFIQTDSPIAIEDRKEDKTRGIVRFVGKPNKSYLNPNYVDFVDLSVGDEVLYNPNTPLFKLERLSTLAQFNGNELYNVVQRRRVAMILKKSVSLYRFKGNFRFN